MAIPKATATRGAAIAVALAASACARAPAPAAPPPGRQRAADLAPIADHHQHLLSPAGAARANRTLPAVALPDELARVVEERTARWNDPAGLAPLYTEDAIARSLESPWWIAGRAEVAAYVGTRFAAPYRMVAGSYRRGATSAEVAGYLVRGEGAAARPIAYLLLALERGGDGRWRIAAESSMPPGPEFEEPETAEQLVGYLDDAGIRKAVVLSNAYILDSPRGGLADREAKLRAVQAENDWTADQVARFPGRLVALCSFSPLEDYGVAELERCASSGRFRGLKLHFGTSRVDLLNPEHVAKVRRVMQAANRLRMPMTIHVRADPKAYGREHARAFLELVGAAPDVPVTIAHLWGGEAFSDEALAVYADAVSSGDPRARNLYFDTAEIALATSRTPEVRPRMVARMRQIGFARILYGSDGPVAESWTPAQSWKETRALPLTEEELRVLAGNVAPYLR